MTHSRDRPPITLVTATPLSRSPWAMGSTTAVPTPPPTHTAWPSSMSLVGMPSRAGDIEDRFADGERDEVGSALADGLDRQRDGAAIDVGVGDGQRDPFSARACPDDRTWPRLRKSTRYVELRRPGG